MLGGLRKTAIAAGALGLLTTGLALSHAPAQAATGNACVIAASPADVYNVEYGVTGAGHPGQQPNGSWNSPGIGVVPRYGLYYPATDPTLDHVTPRAENHGGAPSSLPATPVQTGDHFRFAQGGSCAQDSTITFSTEGNGIGYCGRSVGLGVGKVGNESVIIRWESVGSQLVMLDHTARGSVNAQANPPGDAKGSCLTGTAITFLVDGALVDTRTAP